MPFRNPIFLLPIFSFIWVIVTLFITLMLAYFYGHIPTNAIPYISMLGDWPPERGFFSMMLCMGALWLSIIVWCRFRQITEQIDGANRAGGELVPPMWYTRMNYAVLVFGMLCSFGLAATGCYSLTAAPFLHLCSAALFVTGGILSVLLHTILCCSMTTFGVDPYAKHGICLVRGIIATICTCTYLVFLLRLYKGNDIKNMHKPYHMARTSCQWMGTISLAAYYLTYYYEFKRLKIICTFHTEEAGHPLMV